MPIGDTARRQQGFERFLTEVWMAARPWHRPDICDLADLMRGEKLEEHLGRVRRMTDREDHK
jgi:hypothetical protein